MTAFINHDSFINHHSIHSFIHSIIIFIFMELEQLQAELAKAKKIVQQLEAEIEAIIDAQEYSDSSID